LIVTMLLMMMMMAAGGAYMWVTGILLRRSAKHGGLRSSSIRITSGPHAGSSPAAYL